MEQKDKSLIEKTNKKDVKKQTYIILIAIVLVVLAIDQVTKIFAINSNDLVLIENFLKISISENTNGVYGIGGNSTLLYVITNLVVIAVLYKFITSQNQFINTKIKVFASFIIAGGVSNVIDRIIRGYVVEFINFEHLPTFNFADIAVIIGWVSFIAIFTKFTVEELQEKKNKTEKKLEDEDNDKK